MSQDASIIARLGLDTAGFRKGMSEAGGALKSLASEVAGIAGVSLSVGGLAAMVKGVVEFADQLQNASDAIGIDVVALQELNAAFAQSGASAEQVEKGLKSLAESSVGARAGNEALAKSFQTLGVSAAELRSLTLDQLVMRIADSASAAQDPNERLAAIIDVLGKSGLRMAAGLNSGSAAIEQLRTSAATVSKQDIANIDIVGDAFDRLVQRGKTAGANAIASLIDPIGKAARDLQRNLDEMRIGPSSEDFQQAQKTLAATAEIAKRLTDEVAEHDRKQYGEFLKFKEEAARKSAEGIVDQERKQYEDFLKDREAKIEDIYDAERKQYEDFLKYRHAQEEKAAEEQKKLAEEVAEKKEQLIEQIQAKELERQEAVEAARENAKQDFVAGKMAGPDAAREAERTRKEEDRLARRFEREQALRDRGGAAGVDANRGNFTDELKSRKERGWEELQRQVERDADKGGGGKDLATKSLTELEQIRKNTEKLGVNL